MVYRFDGEPAEQRTETCLGDCTGTRGLDWSGRDLRVVKFNCEVEAAIDGERQRWSRRLQLVTDSV